MSPCSLRLLILPLTLGLLSLTASTSPAQEIAADRADSAGTPLVYINTAFENASPLFWDVAEDGLVTIRLVYDHERASLNRANGHWHFQIQAEPGDTLRLALANFHNIYNGRPSNPLRGDHLRVVVSEDGESWRSVPATLDADRRLLVELEMPKPSLYVASVAPYRLSDLDKLLSEIQDHPLVEVTTIGQTVEGRPLEIVRIGRPEAPHRVLIRARAHPWEPGGNWVVEGLIRGLLSEDAANARYLERYAVYILPMANKDGVARGRTRFNVQGVDLNRGWDVPADSTLAPENTALEAWLDAMIRQGRKPDLALELHNDKEGQLHFSPPPPGSDYLANMEYLETLLRAHTWFTEGSRVANTGSTFGAGLTHRYGIDALVYELDSDWIAGLGEPASAAHWQTLGEGLRAVFYDYFGEQTRRSR